MMTYNLKTMLQMLGRFHLLFVLLLFVVLTTGCQRVDLIVHNAEVYTVDKDFSMATAFVVDEGKFIAVGGEELVKKYRAKNIVNAAKLPIYPGFIDAHCHFLSLGMKKNQLDLTNTKSYDEVLEHIADFVVAKRPDFLIGYGWDQTKWPDKQFPNKKPLDILYPNLPIVLKRIDGHALLVNQKVLDLAGIKHNTQVKGGTIVKENNQLTGIIIDKPMDLIYAVFPTFSEKTVTDALLAAQDLCFKNGLTTVSDAGLNLNEITLINQLHQQDKLLMRIYAMVSASDTATFRHFLDRGPLKTAKLNVRSFKVYADGALGSRGAVLKKPYSDDKSNKGTFITPPDSIQSLAYRLAVTPFQMNTHAIGDAANSVVLHAYKKALAFSNYPRWRIEHVQIIDTTDLHLFNHKIIPSVQPTHATSDMPWVKDRLGKNRLSGAYAYKALLNKSGKIVLGTDFPVEKINPMLTFFAAVFRQNANYLPEGGFLPENAISKENALRGMTIWAAYANFEETEKGSIEPGKFADFVILDRDIMSVAPQQIPKTRVVATILNGKIVFSNRF